MACLFQRRVFFVTDFYCQNVKDMDIRFTFEYSKIHKQASLFHDYNRAMNGDNVQYQIKKSHSETLRLLLILYVKQVIRFYNQDSLASYYEKHRELPPFKTFACSVQKACKMGSKSTFYDQRRRLMNTGLLLKVDRDPSTAGQLWYFNPVLFVNSEGESYVKKYVGEHFSARKTLEAQQPNFDVFALLSTVSVRVQAQNMLRANIISHVDNVDKSSHQCDMRSASHPGNVARNFARSAAGSTGKLGDFLSDDLKKNVGVAKKNDSHAPDYSPESTKKAEKQEIPAFILALVINFWAYAKEQLFENMKISQDEERIVKNLIYAQYFKQWRRFPEEKQWESYFQNLKRQVDISKREVHKKGYLMPAPSYYFAPRDPNQKKEFKFYKVEEMLARNVYDQVHLELRKWQRGRGRCKKMTSSELMKRHFGMLLQISHPKYINHFTQNMSSRYVRKHKV